MSDPISGVTAIQSAGDHSMTTLSNNLLDVFKRHEAYLHKSIKDGLAPNGELMGLPDHVKQQFKQWDQEFTDPKHIAMVKKIKSKMLEMNQNNENYIKEQISKKSDAIKLEMAMKAISKSTQGIKQILSGQ